MYTTRRLARGLARGLAGSSRRQLSTATGGGKRKWLSGVSVERRKNLMVLLASTGALTLAYRITLQKFEHEQEMHSAHRRFMTQQRTIEELILARQSQKQRVVEAVAAQGRELRLRDSHVQQIQDAVVEALQTPTDDGQSSDGGNDNATTSTDDGQKKNKNNSFVGIV